MSLYFNFSSLLVRITKQKKGRERKGREKRGKERKRDVERERKR